MTILRWKRWILRTTPRQETSIAGGCVESKNDDAIIHRWKRSQNVSIQFQASHCPSPTCSSGNCETTANDATTNWTTAVTLRVPNAIGINRTCREDVGLVAEVDGWLRRGHPSIVIVLIVRSLHCQIFLQVLLFESATLSSSSSSSSTTLPTSFRAMMSSTIPWESDDAAVGWDSERDRWCWLWKFQFTLTNGNIKKSNARNRFSALT